MSFDFSSNRVASVVAALGSVRALLALALLLLCSVEASATASVTPPDFGIARERVRVAAVLPSYVDTPTLAATPNHPLWSRERAAWVPAGALVVGEAVGTLSGEMAVVVARRRGPPQRVVNLEVWRTHTFYAGAAAVSASSICAIVSQETIGWTLEAVRRLPEEGLAAWHRVLRRSDGASLAGRYIDDLGGGGGFEAGPGVGEVV